MASIHWCISLLVGLAFATSGLAKLRSRRFVSDLANYRLLPVPVVVPVASLLPWIELTVGVLAVALPDNRIALWGSSALLVVFAAGMSINLARGRVISCGCRGTDKPVSWSLVVTNLALATAAAFASTYTSNPTQLPVAQVAAVVGCVVAAGLAIRLAQHLRELKEVLAHN